MDTGTILCDCDALLRQIPETGQVDIAHIKGYFKMRSYLEEHGDSPALPGHLKHS